jgi:alanine-synthesizing transaminase
MNGIHISFWHFSPEAKASGLQFGYPAACGGVIHFSGNGKNNKISEKLQFYIGNGYFVLKYQINLNFRKVETMQKIFSSKRTKNITYAIRDIVLVGEKLKSQGMKVLPLNIGDPLVFDFETPRHMIEAAYKAMLSRKNSYAPSHGVPEAIDAIKSQCRDRGFKNIQNVFTTNGASEAIELALNALVNEGENVLGPQPGYPLYNAVLNKLRADMNPYYLKEGDTWEIDPEDIRDKINEKTRGIIILNPSNPTGGFFSENTLRQVVKIAKEHNLVIFADEIYDQMIFDGRKHTPVATLDDEICVVTINGISKNYLACGWRIGWGIITGNPDLCSEYSEAINKLLRARLCANHAEQYAIKPALEGPQDHIPEMVKRLQERRDITYARLNAIKNISCAKPLATFYAFPRLHIDTLDKDFVIRLLEETGVMTVFGSGFGQYPGTQHLRIVFLPTPDVLNESFDKIEAFMKKWY